jgi:hypothetical protein
MEVVDMKRFSIRLLIGFSFLISLTANAQTWGQRPYYPQRDDRYARQRGNYPNQGRYGNDGYGYGRNQDPMIGRVMGDLSRAAANARLDGHERKHFDEVAQNLQEFEVRWAQGKFDTGKLDKAIRNLEHLVDADRVRGRDRDMLARDVRDLRQFRSTRGRYSDYGYGDYRDDRYNPYR